jgi:hypothetical protein
MCARRLKKFLLPSAQPAGMRANAPEEGEGLVGRIGMGPAVLDSRRQHQHRVGDLHPSRWNPLLERRRGSWNCPLHGSRFDPAGRVLEESATADLTRLEQ